MNGLRIIARTIAVMIGFSILIVTSAQAVSIITGNDIVATSGNEVPPRILGVVLKHGAHAVDTAGIMR